MTESGSSGGGTKYEIPDDHEWADEKMAETDDQPPRAEVKSHAVEILHRGRNRTDGERDIRYGNDPTLETFTSGEETTVADGGNKP
jgi:hypothetical protein